jgi:hypothetical protein
MLWKFALASIGFGARGVRQESARLVGSAAKLSEEAAGAAAAVLRAGANFTQFMSATAVDAAASTLALTKEMSHGVDLWNLTLTSNGGVMVADNGPSFPTWLSSDNGPQVVDLTPPQRYLLQLAAREVSPTLPHLKRSDIHFDLLASYCRFEVEARPLPSGYFGFRRVRQELPYRAQRSTPLWSALDLQLDQERSQVLQYVERTLASAPEQVDPPQLLDSHLASGQLPALFKILSGATYVGPVSLRTTSRGFCGSSFGSRLVALSVCNKWIPKGRHTGRYV